MKDCVNVRVIFLFLLLNYGIKLTLVKLNFFVT